MSDLNILVKEERLDYTKFSIKTREKLYKTYKKNSICVCGIFVVLEKQINKLSGK